MGVRGAICKWRFVIIVARRRRRRSACLIFLEKHIKSYGLVSLVCGLEFLLSYVGTEATQKGRFDSESAYFPSNFLYSHWPAVSRWAATPPSHRAGELLSSRTPGKRAHLAHTDPENRSRCPPRMRCPDTAVFRPSPPLVARSLTRLAIRSGQTHPGLSTHPQPEDWQQLKSHNLRAIRPPGHCGRVRAVRNSPSDVIACQRVVRRHTCSPVTRRSMRATQARGTSWGPRRPASPKDRT